MDAPSVGRILVISRFAKEMRPVETVRHITSNARSGKNYRNTLCPHQVMSSDLDELLGDDELNASYKQATSECITH